VRILRGAKKLMEAAIGCDIEWYGAKTFTVIDKRHRGEAPFSYRAQLRTTIERLAIDLVIDVGSNEGQFAQHLRTFYSGEVQSFEPVSSTFERLARAAALDPHWKVHKLALGSVAGSQAINVSNATVFSSLLTPNDQGRQLFGARTDVSRTEVISVRRLDDVLDEIAPDAGRRRIFLKMDTQGYDLEVFKGLGNKVRCVSAILSEVSLVSIYEGMPHWTESIRLYEEAGFGVVGMFPVNRADGRVIEYDCLLARAGTA
jgi:FkbM family methyltransferase